MKQWLASYSVKCRNGHEAEIEVTGIWADNITKALEVLKRDHTDKLKNDPNVEKVVIWNICIIDDDVFPEEGEGYDL